MRVGLAAILVCAVGCDSNTAAPFTETGVSIYVVGPGSRTGLPTDNQIKVGYSFSAIVSNTNADPVQVLSLDCAERLEKNQDGRWMPSVSNGSVCYYVNVPGISSDTFVINNPAPPGGGNYRMSSVIMNGDQTQTVHSIEFEIIDAPLCTSILIANGAPCRKT